MPVLSRVQQNDIHELTIAAGLDPAGFVWKSTVLEYSGTLLETLSHAATQSHCSFYASDGKTHVSWWPSTSPGGANYPAPNWPSALSAVERWLNEVKVNHDAPDLWAEVAKARGVTDAAADVEAENTPLTRAELDGLKPTLDEIQAYIASRQSLSETQQQALQGRFRYLLAAAKRGLGRIDWLNVFVSQIVQMFADGMLHSSLYGEVMRHAATALGTILKLGTKLLGQ